MGIIITLVVGGIIGWVASLIMKTDGQQGLIFNILIGIAGSFLGDFVAKKLGIGADGDVMRYGIMLGGAVLLIVILRFVGVLK